MEMLLGPRHFAKAFKVYPTHSSLGVIPNWQRAEEILLEEDRRFPGRSNLISLPPYERVIQISAYPLPRPVVIYGPLAALACRKLVQTSGTFGAARFEVPPVNAAAATATATANAPAGPGASSETARTDEVTTGVIRLSAIKRAMSEHGSHCLLDLNLTAVSRLILLGIPPIVILISPTSREQLRAVLEQYWDLDKTSPALLRPRKPLRKRAEVKELAEKLWKDVMHLRHFKSHLLTDTAPLIPANGQSQTFSEVDWLQNLIAVIMHQQNQPVWIGEETQLAQDLLEKAAKQEEPDQAAFKEPPMKDGTAEKPSGPSPSLSNELEQINRLTTQLTLLNEQNNEAMRDTSKPAPDARRNESIPARPVAGIRSEKHTPPGTMRQIPIGKNFTDRWPPSPQFRPPPTVDPDETDASWASDLPQPPDEVTITSPRSNTENKPGMDKTDSTIFNAPGSSDKIVIQRMPTNFLLDAFGICVHATMDDSPLSTHRTITIEEVADAATLTSPRGAEMHMSGCPSGWNTSRVVCTSRSSTLERTNTLDLGSLEERHSTVSSVPFTASKSILAECAGEFGQDGGALELPEHQVRLFIPPGALPIHPPTRRLFLRVYASDPNRGPQLPNQSPALSQRLVSPLVMCGPRGLRFRIPVELTVPRYHVESDFDSESDVSQRSRSGHTPRITLLHTSSFSTSTSADEDYSSAEQPKTDMSKTHYATWHEIPLVQPNQLPVPTGDGGIKSVIRNSTICISIDHF
ncbi:unnamed protein product [Echinostoma caproni]|uniref:ZU5 domain-containing protein n=1 Tax=Echinostoma caproni TaxID=27848 RepID=A0A183AFY7_9TREM|nr:unnamed protein product [Echinostoma caproni]